MEQDLKMRMLKDRLESGEVDYKDLVTVFIAMQEQNFVLANSLMNLVKNWPNENHLFVAASEGIPVKIRIKE